MLKPSTTVGSVGSAERGGPGGRVPLGAGVRMGSDVRAGVVVGRGRFGSATSARRRRSAWSLGITRSRSSSLERSVLSPDSTALTRSADSA